MTEIDTRRAQLLARLADLTGRLVAVGAELDSHNNPDWSERTTERETDEVLEAVGLSSQAEIRQIEAALNRISDGDYGICTKCGAEIGKARLDLLPHTPFCRNCAA